MKVPMIYQAQDSVDCGLAMVAMIQGYHGEKVTVSDLKEKIKVYESEGTFMPQLGMYFLEQGFSDVKIISQDLHLFTLQDRHRSQHNLERKLRRLQKQAKRKRTRYNYVEDIYPAARLLGLYADFLSQGGHIIVKIPSEEDIRKEIQAERPVGAVLASRYLYERTPFLNSHANVIVGIRKQDIFVHDPVWDGAGGKKKYRIEDYIYGIHANNGELLCVRR